MASAPSDRSRQGRPLPSDLTALLPWCASLLLVLYLVGVLNSVIPLQVSTPQWQLRLCEALINQSPLVLMGLSVAIVGRHLQPDNAGVDRLLRWTQRAALPLTLGFALLIPLQGSASLQLLQTANRSSTELITSTTRNLTAAQAQIARAGSTAELETLVNQLPLRLPPLAQLGTNLGAQQQQLRQVLDQVRGRTLLQVQLNRQQQQTLVLRNSVRLSLLAALLACVFQQARQRPQRLAMPNWRNLAWRRPRQDARQRTLTTDLARYCDGLDGDVPGRG